MYTKYVCKEQHVVKLKDCTIGLDFLQTPKFKGAKCQCLILVQSESLDNTK